MNKAVLHSKGLILYMKLRIAALEVITRIERKDIWMTTIVIPNTHFLFWLRHVLCSVCLTNLTFFLLTSQQLSTSLIAESQFHIAITYIIPYQAYVFTKSCVSMGLKETIQHPQPKTSEEVTKPNLI